MTSKCYYFTLIVLFASNFILKIWHIATNNLAGDEPFSVYHAQMDISSMLAQLNTGNNPPLYELMLHFWIKIGGIGEFWVRIPSVLFSSICVVYVFRIGNQFFNYKIGIVASLIITFSNYHTIFAHEARVYALFAMLTTISMYYFLVFLESQQSKKNSWPFIICIVLLLYAHYFSLFVLVAQTCIILSIKEFRTMFLKKWLLLLMLFTICFAPYIFILWHQFTTTASKGSWVPPLEGVESMYNMIWEFSNQPIIAVIGILLVIGGLLKFTFFNVSYQKSNTLKSIFIWFFVPFILMFIISIWLPIFFNRYLIFVSIAYYITLALSIDILFDKKWLKNSIAAILILLYAFSYSTHQSNDKNVIEATNKIKVLKSSTTDVIICPQHFLFNFIYYFDSKIFENVENNKVNSDFIYSKINTILSKQGIVGINSINEYVPSQNVTCVLYLDIAADAQFPENSIKPFLNDTYTYFERFSFGAHFELYSYKNMK